VQPHLRGKDGLTVTTYDRVGSKLIATGKLLTLDNQIDTTTGTVKARAIFNNKDNVLYPNQFVNARLLVNTEHDAILIPTSTIQHNGTASFVYVLQNDFAHMQSVNPGVTDGGTTAVTGVKDGDILANSSFDKLQDKSQIKVSKEPIPASNVGSSAP
jgi:multidrug efflux system membrane fusion protein